MGQPTELPILSRSTEASRCNSLARLTAHKERVLYRNITNNDDASVTQFVLVTFFAHREPFATD